MKIIPRPHLSRYHGTEFTKRTKSCHSAVTGIAFFFKVDWVICILTSKWRHRIVNSLGLGRSKKKKEWKWKTKLRMKMSWKTNGKKGRPVSGDDDLVVVVAFFLCWLIWIFFSLMRRVRSRRHSFGFTRSVRRAPARERTVWNVAGRRTLANNPLINVVQSRLIDASLSVSLEVISSDGVSNYFVGFNGNEIQWVISRTTTTT